MTAQELTKRDPIDVTPAVCIFRTRYENEACRVLEGLLLPGMPMLESGYIFTENRFEIWVKGVTADDVELAEHLTRWAAVVAHTDLAPMPLQRYNQFDRW